MGQGHCSRASCIELSQYLVAPRHQRVDPKIQWWPASERARLIRPALTKCALQQRPAPIRGVGTDNWRSGGKLSGRDCANLCFIEGRGRKAVAIERAVDGFRCLVPFQKQRSQRQRSRGVRIEQPGCGPFAAKRVIDDVADRSAVTRPGKTM